MGPFVIVTGGQRFYIVECYIPPTDLSTLAQVEQALNECPKGHTLLLLGDLNINQSAPRDERDEGITKVVEEVVGLNNLSKHFCRRSCGDT